MLTWWKISQCSSQPATTSPAREPRCARHAPHERSAFTLIELVLVLAIMAIAMALITPSLSAYAKGRDTINTAGMFVATARWCRAQSISTGNLYRLTLDTTNNANKWTVTYDKGGGNFADAQGELASFTLPTGVTMTSDAPKGDGSNTQVIEFDPSGRSDPATIHFLGPKNASADVACDTPSDLYHVLPQNQNGGR